MTITITKTLHRKAQGNEEFRATVKGFKFMN